MPDPFRHVRHLTQELGPRPGMSAAEQLGARYLSQEAQAYTPHVWNEPFRAPGHVRWIDIGLLVLTLLGCACLWWRPVVGLVAMLLFGGLWFLHALGYLRLTRFLPHRSSQSVVAVVAPRRAIRRRIVFIANYDTFHQGWGKRHRLVDNAGGVALALELGELIARAPLRYTEVWSVFTGCHGNGMAGLRSFLERHGTLLSDAYWIVLEGIGAGRVRYTMKHGVREADQALLRLANALAIARPTLGVGPLRRNWRPTAATALLKRKYRAIAIQSDKPDAEPDPVAFDAAVRYLRHLVKQLDQGKPI